MSRSSRTLLAVALTVVLASPAAGGDESCWITRAADTVGAAAASTWRDVVDWGDRTLDAAERALSDYPLGLRAYVMRDGEPAWTPVEELQDPLPERVALLIHGLDEPGGIWDDLAPALAAEGHGVVRFDYPNDQSIGESADLLLEALADQRALGARRVAIVAHSMGGLVARDALTRPDAPAGVADVERLITVGTPNHGAPLAGMRWVAETREFVATLLCPPEHRPRAPFSVLTDGDGAAGRDLKPGSAFLSELNARRLPEHLDVTIIAGVWAPIEREELEDTLARALRWIPWSERVLPERPFETLAASTERAALKLGDGAVPLDSTPLETVTDHVVLEAHHRSLLRGANAPAIGVILDRLGAAEEAEPQASGP